jgi:hypothetical protein
MLKKIRVSADCLKWCDIWDSRVNHWVMAGNLYEIEVPNVFWEEGDKWMVEYMENEENPNFDWIDFNQRGIEITKRLIPYLKEDIELSYLTEKNNGSLDSKILYILHPQYKEEVFKM